MEPEDATGSRDATADEIRMAIETLTPEESARLRLAATYCLPGTEYDHFQDLINEAVMRAMSAAAGEAGRHWKIGVKFIAFMIMTVRGLSDDSRESLVQRKTRRLELMTPEGGASEDVIGALGHSNPSVLDLAVENQERIEREERAKADADAIDAHFAGDDNIGWIVMGHKDDQSPAEIQQISGMTQTQYNSARRKFVAVCQSCFLPGARNDRIKARARDRRSSGPRIGRPGIDHGPGASDRGVGRRGRS